MNGEVPTLIVPDEWSGVLGTVTPIPNLSFVKSQCKLVSELNVVLLLQTATLLAPPVPCGRDEGDTLISVPVVGSETVVALFVHVSLTSVETS